MIAFNLTYYLCLILFSITIGNLLLKSNYINNIVFYLLAIIILNIGLVIFWYYYNNIAICLILSLLLMTLTYIFILEIRLIYHQKIKLCLPYLILTIFEFAFIINRFLCLAHQ